MYEYKEARIQLREGLPIYSTKAISCDQDVAELLKDEMRKLDRENLWALNLDSKQRVINYTVVSIGSLNTANFRIADVFNALRDPDACQTFASGKSLIRNADGARSDGIITL